MSTAAQLQPGDRIADRYVLAEEIGRGGMAVVYRARDLQNERDVAVKFLERRLTHDIGEERFRREIQIAAGLTHPHIVPLHDWGEWDGRLYYVMALIDGPDLRSVLQREKKLPLARALEIAHDVGEALSHAHSKGVVHRDIKPGNIILTESYAVVTDFGVAKALGSASEDLTGSDAALGTPRYMAPEQATNPGGVSASSDTYSLGCVVYEMLTGQPPFPGDQMPALIADHLLKDPPSICELDPSIPEQVAAAVQRAIAKSPEARFPTVEDFVDTLERTAEGRARLRWGGRARWLTAGLVATAVLLSFATVLRPAGAGAWVDGKPSSVVVLPYADDRATEEERELSIRMAEDLTTGLMGWDATRVVPGVAVSGPLFDRGIRDRWVSRTDDAAAVARELDAAAVVLLRAVVAPDGVRAEATLIDVTPGWLRRGHRVVGDPTLARAAAFDLSLIEPVAKRLLGLEHVTEPVLGTRRGSTVTAALQEFDRGQRALEAWQLDEAIDRFRAALVEDSTYALAHLRLGQTLFWQIEAEPSLANANAEAAFRSAATALRMSETQGLTGPVADHITAFHALGRADYRAARDAYDAILTADPTDLYALLMSGAVEYWDRGLANTDAQTPSADWNRAMQRFRRAVELRPSFWIGYGNLFRIHRRLALSDDLRQCIGFGPAGTTAVPWARNDPSGMQPFCPVLDDSIRWVSHENMTPEAVSAARTRAGGLLAEATTLLTRWAAFDTLAAQPHEELARLRLEAFEAMGTTPPEEIRAAAADIASALRASLARRTDTLAVDLARLAAAEYGADRFDNAATLLDVARELVDGDPADPTAMAATPSLALGRTRQALDQYDSYRVRRFVPSPTDGRMLAFGDAMPELARAVALAAVLAPPDTIRLRLAAAEAAWADYGDSDRALLRANAGPMLASVFALHPELLDEWEIPAESPNALLRFVLDTAQPDFDASALAGLWNDVLSATSPTTVRAFTGGLVARRLGSDDLALRTWTATDSLGPRLRGATSEWAMKTTSLLLRAEVEAASGNADVARSLLDRLELAWLAPDDSPATVRSRVGRLRGALQDAAGGPQDTSRSP